VLSANNLRSARLAPIIGAAFKMFVPFIVIVPGLLALVLLRNPDGSIMHLVGEDIAVRTGQHSYNEVLPLMMVRYFGPGLLGMGITALVAGFMSGMAGNISAFSTVWTYDLYGAYLNKKASDAHYVLIGRWCTVIGMLISVGTAYLVMNAASIMDYVQALFSFFIAPLFGTVILGMLWKRATNAGGFWGLLIGTISSVSMWAWVQRDAGALRYIALSSHAQSMAENLYRALWSWCVCVVVTVIVSLATKPKSDAELAGLVYGATVIPMDESERWYQKPIFWAIVVATVLFIFNLILW